MKSTKNVKSTSIEFEVTFDQNDFEPARLKALERLARNIKVPGFRNGKAPANVVGEAWEKWKKENVIAMTADEMRSVYRKNKTR